MHCPRCGADAVIGQQFCRSCGLNLEKVSELLAEQPPAPVIAARISRLERWANIARLSLLSLVFLTLIYVLISELMIKGGHFAAGLLLLIFFISTAVVVGLQFYSQTLKQRLTNPNSTAIPNVFQLMPTRQLDTHRDPTLSVTEHTTELLPAPPLTRRGETKEV